MPDHRRRVPVGGFTLFEVAIALLITGAVIATALAIFPSGIQVQQLARYRLLATVKAYQLIEAFQTSGTSNNSIDIEAPNAWDVPSSYSNLANDFEAKLCTRGMGICPLPPAIARRLDSDGDEIQRVLDGGGQLYYCAVSDTVEQDAQKLVFTVDGYAQQNAISQFHAKRWPYYAPYPSPPQIMQHDKPVSGSLGSIELPGNAITLSTGTRFSLPWASSGTVFGIGLDDTNNTHGHNVLWDAYGHEDDASFISDVQKAFCWNEGGVLYGSFPYTEITPQDAATMTGMAERAFVGAMWFAQQSNMDASACESITAPLIDFQGNGCPHWRQVLAMRYLAFAATCLTRWKTHSDLTSNSYTIPVATLDGKPLRSTVIVTEDKIRWWYDSAINLVDLLVATDPYDWGVPRPAERPMMMDMPLLQWDLFSPPDTGTITGAGVKAAQWKPLSAQTVTHPGCSYSDPGPALVPGTFGSAAAHFSLTARFEAAERCRQLVFWSVDWQSYDDCETAPSAPVDAARWPKAAPWSGAQGYDDTLTPLDWISAHQISYRNPELYTIFLHDMTAVATGAELKPRSKPNEPAYAGDVFDPTDVFADDDKTDYSGHQHLQVFSGLYGADRNGNHRLDRGPIGPSTRLHARSVARVCFYDPRLCVVLR